MPLFDKSDLVALVRELEIKLQRARQANEIHDYLINELEPNQVTNHAVTLTSVGTYVLVVCPRDHYLVSKALYQAVLNQYIRHFAEGDGQKVLAPANGHAVEWAKAIAHKMYDQFRCTDSITFSRKYRELNEDWEIMKPIFDEASPQVRPYMLKKLGVKSTERIVRVEEYAYQEACPQPQPACAASVSTLPPNWQQVRYSPPVIPPSDDPAQQPEITSIIEALAPSDQTLVITPEHPPTGTNRDDDDEPHTPHGLRYG